MHSIQYNHIHTLFDIQLTAIKSLPCGFPQEIWMLWDGLHIRCNVRSDKFQLIVVEQGRPCWHVDCSDSHVVVQGGAAFLVGLGSTITRRFRTILSPELRHIVRVRWVEERGSHVTTATDNTNQSWSHRQSGHTVTLSTSTGQQCWGPPSSSSPFWSSLGLREIASSRTRTSTEVMTSAGPARMSESFPIRGARGRYSTSTRETRSPSEYDEFQLESLFVY